MARIELDKVSKAWGDVVAVEPTSIDINDGEFVAILGPSGCGKSTTLLMLAGIYDTTSGEIRFDGKMVNGVETKDRNIGIVFQSYALYPHMSVRDNILFPLKFKKMDKQESNRLIEEIAGLVQVDELLDRRPSQLSGGQQQRVALARALVKSPQLLLLDEPLSNLDATLRLSMRAEIKALQQRTSITTILVTHDQLEATTMADRIICMSKGRIEQVGKPDDLYHRPASLFVASFIGAPPMNLLEGKCEGNHLKIGSYSLSLNDSFSGELTLGIRPEMLSFSDSGIEGKVKVVEPMGREVLYLVSCGMGDLRILCSTNAVEHEVGDTVFVTFSTESSLIFDSKTEKRLEGVKATLAEKAVKEPQQTNTPN